MSQQQSSSAINSTIPKNNNYQDPQYRQGKQNNEPFEIKIQEGLSYKNLLIYNFSYEEQEQLIQPSLYDSGDIQELKSQNLDGRKLSHSNISEFFPNELAKKQNNQECFHFAQPDQHIQEIQAQAPIIYPQRRIPMRDDEEATGKPLDDRIGIRIDLRAEVIQSDGILIGNEENIQSQALINTLTVLPCPIGKFDPRMRHFLARLQRGPMLNGFLAERTVISRFNGVDLVYQSFEIDNIQYMELLKEVSMEEDQLSINNIQLMEILGELEYQHSQQHQVERQMRFYDYQYSQVEDNPPSEDKIQNQNQNQNQNQSQNQSQNQNQNQNQSQKQNQNQLEELDEEQDEDLQRH